MQTVWTQIMTDGKSGSHMPYLVTYSCKGYLMLMGKKINFLMTAIKDPDQVNT